MASLRPAFTQLRGRCRTSAPPCQQLRQMLQGLQISPKARHTRPLSIGPSRPDDIVRKDELITASEIDHNSESKAPIWRKASSLNPAEEGLRHGWVPSESTASEDLHDAAGTEGPRGMIDSYEGALRGQESERPLVDHPQQANGGFPGDNGEFDGESYELEGENGDADSNRLIHMVHARAMPVSPSYFSRQTEFNDSYLRLQKLMRKYAHLPTLASDQVEKVAFRTLKDYRLAVGEDVKASEYAKCMSLVKRLHKIHPKLAPSIVKDAIAPFKRDINPYIHADKQIPVDKFGRALGVGKRKTSVARAWVVEGMGEVLVNGKSLADAFGRIHDRESAVWALKATARSDKYNVWALVEGGGTTGQAEALAMAVGKALLAHEPALKPALRRAGVVTRDPRGVERKKAGHLKARKKPAWVKR